MIDKEQLKAITLKLSDWCRSRQFAGFDPYDTLNSPFTGILSLGTKLGRIALTQFGRRSPVNCRFLLGVRSSVNPKALGLFLEGYTKIYRLHPDPVYKEILNLLFVKLCDLRSPNVSGAAWGYNFPWQNRVQLVPRWTPTIVNSSFIGHALLDYYDLCGIEEARDMALAIPTFFLNNLNRKKEGSSFCFGYTPKDENFVHNANMLGASLLARIAKQFGRNDLLDPAQAALSYSMKYQHEDGSWFYGEARTQHWIDSFHTGFDLEALRRFLRFGFVPEYMEAYKRGVEFYANNFFLSDGTPKYYHNRIYLADIHAPAEAMVFFSEAGEKYKQLVERIYYWTLENMYDVRKGVFYYRKSRYLTIKIPYMRWGQAWAFRALTTLLAFAQ